MANVIHERIARIARQELSQRYASVDDQADAMAAAILTGLREDGVAVVELPKPDEDGRFWFREVCYVYVDPEDQMIMTQRDTTHGDADDARETAAALLAAADAAESTPDEDPHAGQLWANELQRRQQQVSSDREWS
jgi:hypothetical protein